MISGNEIESQQVPNRTHDLQYSSSQHFWKRHLIRFSLAISIVFVVGVVLKKTTASDDSGPNLTHTITRGDLVVTVVEQGILESAENTEIKCKVRGQNTVLWVIESGTIVKPGDELVRLDSGFIQEQIDERTKYAHWSRSAAERSAADVARSELAIGEYQQGRYVSELMNLKKELVIAEANLRNARNQLNHADLLARSEYVSQLDVEEKKFAVEQADLNVKLKRTELDVLERFTQAEQMQGLNGNLASTTARHEANVERAIADASRRDRALEEIEYCVLKADRSGMVIHPSAAQWEIAPIEEGATVHKDQVLLLMPDLSKMQVKVGINETVVDRVKSGLIANVTLPNMLLEGTVSSVSSVTRPAGWWTGNVVRYDTLIDLPADHGLRPGMSAEVEIIIAQHKNVLKIPVAAIVESETRNYCWVKTPQGIERRIIELGDSNNVFTVVQKGLEHGEEVLLNPLAYRESASSFSRTVEQKNVVDSTDH